MLTCHFLFDYWYASLHRLVCHVHVTLGFQILHLFPSELRVAEGGYLKKKKENRVVRSLVKHLTTMYKATSFSRFRGPFDMLSRPEVP